MRSNTIKFLLPFLSFLLLLPLPLIKFIGFETEYASFGSIPLALLLALSFSLFISLEILFCKKNIKDIKTDKLIFIPILLYFVMFSILSILKHISFFSTGLDLGFYNQGMWGLIHGIMPTSITGYPLLGSHVQPVLLLLTPFYFLYHSPITLVIIQTFFIAIGAVPLYLLAKEKLGSSLSSLIISVSYLTYLPLWYANLFDFHPIVLALPFLTFALYFLNKKRYTAFVISMVLASACKEYISLLFIPFGFYLFVKHKKRLLALITAVLGLMWFIVAINLIIPYFLGSSYPHLSSNPIFGNSLYEVFKTFIFHPLFVLKQLVTFNRLAYLALLFAPVGFVFAFFAPEFLFLGITEFMIVLLHGDIPLSEIVYHHQISLVPFILSATVIGIHRITRMVRHVKFKFVNKNNMMYAITIFIFLMGILSNAVYGPFSILYDLNDFDISTDYVKTGHKVVDMIPADASVAVPNWVLPHLSNRDNIFRLSDFLKNAEHIQKIGNPEYIVLDFSDALYDPKRSARKIDIDSYHEVLNNPNYSVIYQENSWFLLRHK